MDIPSHPAVTNVEALIAGIESQEQAEKLALSFEKAQEGINYLAEMLQNSNIPDFINISMDGSVIKFLINTPYTATHNYGYRTTIDKEELSSAFRVFMTVDLMRVVDVLGTRSYLQDNDLRNVYSLHPFIIHSMVTHVEVQELLNRPDVNPIIMYVDVLQTVLNIVKQEFANKSLTFSEEKFKALFILRFFQEQGMIEYTNFNVLFKLVSDYEDLSLMAGALNHKIFEANNNQIVSEQFMKEAQGLPTEWIVSILKEDIQEETKAHPF